MAVYHIHSSEMKAAAPTLRAGDTVYLDGLIYTARDAAHSAPPTASANASTAPTIPAASAPREAINERVLLLASDCDATVMQYRLFPAALFILCIQPSPFMD